MNYEFSRSIENGRNILSLSLSNDLIDEITLRTLMQDKPEFLTKFTVFQDGMNRVIQYDVTGLTPLSYDTKVYSSLELIDLLLDMLSTLMSSYDWFMDYHNFKIDHKSIMMNNNTNKFQLLYIPIKESISTEQEIKNCFIELISQLNLSSAEKVVNKILFFLIKDFFLVNFQQFLNELREEVVKEVGVKTPQKPLVEVKEPVKEVKPITDEQPSLNQVVSTPVNIQPMIQPIAKVESNTKGQSVPVPNSKPKKGIFGDLFSKKDKSVPKSQMKKSGLEEEIEKRLGTQSVKQPANHQPVTNINSKANTNTPLMMGATSNHQPSPSPMISAVPKKIQSLDSEVTEFLDIDTFDGLHLKYVGTYDSSYIDEIIPIEFINNGFRIGRFDITKGQKRLEFEFHQSIKHISRTHVRIEKEDNKYFIIDINSANGTFINGQRINPMYPYEVSINDKISFSNKGLDFILKEN